MAKEIRFLRIAWDEANSSPHQTPMGAIVVAGHRIISRGYNQYKSHPQMIGWNPRRELHAEMTALLRCPDELLDGATVYVVRKDKMALDKSVMLSKPCPACCKMMMKSGIEKIVYSIDGSLTNGMIHYGVMRIK